MKKGWQFWTGWVLTGFVGLGLLGSGGAKLAQAEPVVKNMVDKFGFPPGAVAIVGVVEVLCVLIYLAPPTSVLGAVLITGYLGGALATHASAGDPMSDYVGPFLLAVFAWGGLFLRDERVRALLPLRKPAATAPGA